MKKCCKLNIALLLFTIARSKSVKRKNIIEDRTGPIKKADC